MSEGLSALETMVGAQLAKEPNPTPERIRQLIAGVRATPLVSDVDDEAAEQLARTFEARHGVSMTIGAVLTEADYVPWLDGVKAGIAPYYWNRYRKLLAEKHFAGQVISTIDSVTDRVLGLLENPTKGGQWDRRGMVVGHVQSGKTANYIGLICKAADAGYKLIVVIAGIHNNLRNQTQIRIDEGFVGRDSARLLSMKGDRFIGVGRHDKTRRPVTFTNSMRDFNKAMATGIGIPLQNLNEPAVFVIKKNSSTLDRLIEWLKEHSAKAGARTVDAPMLLIDDEADNASINVRHGKDQVSRINGQIRELLQLFERSCYVGYTATPFANIFIDPDSDNEMLGADLFPRHFIVSLDPPSNYFSAEKVFIHESDAIIRRIDDEGDWLPLSHKIDTVVSSLPPRMLEALRTFVVARALRLLRGHEGMHSSMLVNASRFTNVQRQLRNEIHTRLAGIQSSVKVMGGLPSEEALKDPEIAALHQTWNREFADAGFSWEDVHQRLNDAAAPITVVEVNSNSAGTLNYADHQETGLNIIAVGGYSLSRGLTLEGLMVSYFMRNSMMYDTLMQMGRWFGYRPGYEDLCRIWMPEEAEGWYAHITESIEMLREELRIMEAAGATPEEFGLKVRSHPDTLIVTARNKMGSGQKVVVSIGLQKSFIESHILWRDDVRIQQNRSLAQHLVNRLTECGHSLKNAESVPGGWLLRDAPVAPVLEFVGGFLNHPGSSLTDSDPVRQYIADRQDTELAIWDILFTSVSQKSEDTLVDESLGMPIYCQRRTAGKQSTPTTLRISDRQRVSSRGVERIGLTQGQVAAAEAEYRQELEVKGVLSADVKSINYPDRIYRVKREKPLLIVHLLKIDDKNGREPKEAVVAYSISFPSTDTEEKRVEYVVNTTWMRENYRDDLDEDEMSGDDV